MKYNFLYEIGKFYTNVVTKYMLGILIDLIEIF